jgi:RHS repeat-associated protein
MWTWHYDGLLNEFTGRNSKHIYLGESRIVTKISRADGGSTAEERIKQYYYHSDHLGSAQVISNADGQEYERIEYTPYGELWIEKASTAGNIDIPYRFTGKERDEETGLYYYGARYLDSKASRWLSADPALGDYIPGAPVDDEARKRNQSLPGMGGVFNTVNLHLYHYAGNNPVKYTDPDGNSIKDLFLLPFRNIKTAIESAKQSVENYKDTVTGKKPGLKFYLDTFRNVLDTFKEYAENYKKITEDNDTSNINSDDSIEIPEGKWLIQRPDGSEAEIHSGHTHFDKETQRDEQPHTHEHPLRDPRDPKYETSPRYQDRDAHRTTLDEYKMWKDRYGDEQ